MHKTLFFLFAIITTTLCGCAEPGSPPPDIEEIRQRMTDIDRGRYVVVVMGCNDCHTADYFAKRANIPEEDWLVGSTLGFYGPEGTSYPTNLRLLINSISEEEWLALAKKMRRETPMADVMLPATTESDLRAIYRFISHLGPKGPPAPARLPGGVTPTTQYILSPGAH